MTTKKAVKSGTAKGQLKKLTLKKERLADLSATDAQAGQVRGQSFNHNSPQNHNETLVRAKAAKGARNS